MLRSLTSTSHIDNLTKHRKPLNALTGIRICAATYVVVYHAKLGTTLVGRHHEMLGHFLMSGYLSVSMFFLLSGFILAYTYAGQIKNSGHRRRFWEARFARLWPVYFVSLVLTGLTKLIMPKFTYVLATLLMVQAWNPFDHAMWWGAWNYVCWTLSAEAFFYLCFPWYQVRAEKLVLAVQLALIGIMLALCVLFNSGTYVLGHQGTFDSIPLPLLHLPEFFAGVTLGNYFLRRISLQAPKPAYQKPISRGLFTYTSLVFALTLLCRAEDRWTSLVLIPFCTLIFGLASERTLISRFLSTKLMLLGGGISYSIYLMQVAAKFVAKTCAEKLHVASSAFETIVMCLLLFGISTILFLYVEGPARLVLRSMFARLEAARASGKTQKISV